jgi:hypothetical protein
MAMISVSGTGDQRRQDRRPVARWSPQVALQLVERARTEGGEVSTEVGVLVGHV